jgi:hypothetical protein
MKVKLEERQVRATKTIYSAVCPECGRRFQDERQLHLLENIRIHVRLKHRKEVEIEA